MNHTQTIEQLMVHTKRRIGWIQLRMYCLGGVMISIIAGGTHWFFTYGMYHPVDLQVLLGVAGAVLLLLCSLSLLQCRDSINQLQMHLPFFDLRFDVYQAHKDALGDVMADVLPGIRRLGTEVSVLEEMLREGYRVTDRHAKLRSQLTKLYTEARLAEELRELVRISLQVEGAKADADAVTATVERLISGDIATIHPLTRN